MLFLASFLPGKYIAKFVFFAFGCLFWHVSPIIAALPRSDKRRQVKCTMAALSADWFLRIPSLFSDVPTDAEYAMHLISERVAAGLEINPGKIGKKDSSSKQLSKNSSEINLTHGGTVSIKKTFLGGPDIKKLHPGKGVGGLNLTCSRIN